VQAPSRKFESVLGAFAVACACIFVASLAFHHAIALRLYALGVAMVLTFFAGGWREVTTFPLRGAWIAWAAIAALSVILARDRHYSYYEFCHEIIYAFIAFAMWYTLARQHRGARWLGRTIAGLTVTVLAVGIAAYAPERPWFDLGVHGDVGFLSTFLVTILPVLLLLALRSPPRSAARIGAVALAVGCLAAGFLTLNRMFWFAAAAEITIFALFSMRYWRHRHRVAWRVAVAALVAALALFEVLLASESRIALSAPGAGVWEFFALDPRGDLWPFATDWLVQHPWIGAGLGKWSMREVFDAQFHDPLLLHAHNLFLDRALETGLPGLAMFVLLLVSTAIAFGRLARSDDVGTAAIGAAGLALMAGIVLKNLTDDFFVRENALLFWSLTGAALGAGAARQDAAMAAVSRPA
jgi:O-antigen ligase